MTIKQSRILSNKTQPSEAEKVSFLKKIHDKFKGCGAIVMINTTSLAMTIAFLSLVIRLGISPVFDVDNVTFCESSYIVSVIMTSVIAATNPLILIFFNDDIKKIITFWKH